MPIQELGLAGMGQSSERPMAEPIGLGRTVGPAIFSGAFPLPMRITGRLWVKTAPFLQQQMAELGGFTSGVEQPIFFGAFPLQMQITERPLVEQRLMMVEPSFEQQMGDARGLAG